MAQRHVRDSHLRPCRPVTEQKCRMGPGEQEKKGERGASLPDAQTVALIG